MEKEPATGLLFTSMTCPHCPVAKQYFEEIRQERSDVELHSLSVNDSKGQQLAQKFGIRSVPSFVFYGPGHTEPMGLVGGQTKDVLHKYIDIALGKISLQEKKSFSLKNIFKKK